MRLILILFGLSLIGLYLYLKGEEIKRTEGFHRNMEPIVFPAIVVYTESDSSGSFVIVRGCNGKHAKFEDYNYRDMHMKVGDTVGLWHQLGN